MADVFNLQASIGLNTQRFLDGIKNAITAGARLKQSVENQAQAVTRQQVAMDTLKNKLDVAKSATSSVADKVAKLTDEFNKSVKETGAASDETRELASALDKAERELEECTKAEKALNDELDDMKHGGKSAGDAVEKAGKDAEKSKVSFEKFGDALKTVASTAGKVVSAVAKISTAVVSISAAGLTALTKQALEASGTYEQLSGGAQKIFDTMDYSVIANDAANAYKDLNMSVNEYLEAINLAGATFAQTMGDQKGYETARTGMLAIADYASGTGKSIDELNQKYQLITRAASSYQSIADQFSGVLPATSADFLQQAQAAGYLETSYEKLTDVPVAKYQEAVTKMLEKGVEALGLSQNTARESSETITGSLSMVRAAWENLTTAFGSTDMPIDTFVTNFVDSIGAAASNVVPRIEQIINSIGMVFPDLVSILFDTLKSTFEENDIGTVIFSGIDTLVTNSAQVIEDVMKSLFDSLPAVLKGAGNTLGTVAGALWNIFKSAVEILPEKLPEVIDIVGGMIGNLLDILTSDLPSITASISEIITKLIDGLSTLINAESIKNLIPVVVQSILDIASALLDNADTLIDVAQELIVSLGQGLIDSLPAIYDFIYKIVPQIVEILLSNIEPIMNAGFTLLNALLDKLPEILDIVSEQMPQVIYAITDALLQYTPEIIMAGSQMLEALLERTPEIIEMGIRFVGDLITNLIDTFSNNWDDLKQSGIDALTKWWDGARELVDNAYTWGSDLIKNFVSGILSGNGLVDDSVRKVAQKVKDILGFSKPKEGPLSNFHTYAPDMIDLFTSGISENAYKIGDTFNKALDFDTDIGTVSAAVSSTPQSPAYNPAAASAGNSWGELIALLQAILSAVREGKTISVSAIDNALGSLQDLNERIDFA